MGAHLQFPQRFETGPGPQQRARDQVSFDKELKAGQTRNEQRAGLEQAYAQDRLKAIQAGVPESALHPVKAGMDVKAAQANLNFHMGRADGGGAGPAASAAVAHSAVPSNVNSPEALRAGAVAASPAPFTPSRAPLKLPDQKLPPNASQPQVDAALARNVAMAQPGGMNQFRTDKPNGALSRATATVPPVATGSGSAGIGKVLPAAQGDALFGPVVGANGFGSGSVRFAKAGEAQPTAAQTAAATTETGISRQSPAEKLQAQHEALYKSNPEIWDKGSPENQYFVAHAGQYGVQSAYDNAPGFLSAMKESNRATTAKTNEGIDIANAATDRNTADINKAFNAPPVPGVAYKAGQAIGAAGSAIGKAADFVQTLPQRAWEGAKEAGKQVYYGLSGQPAPSGLDKATSDTTSRTADSADDNNKRKPFFGSL